MKLQKALAVIIAASALLATACSTAKIIDHFTWSKIESKNGYSLSIPPGYKVKDDSSGIVIVYKPGGDKDIAFFKTAYGKSIDPEGLATDAINAIEDENPSLKLGDGSDSKYGSFYKLTSSGARGIMLVSVKGESALASGLIGSTKKERKDLIKTVSSFEFRPDLLKLDGKVKLITWTDPKENAFSLKVPSDWNVTGGLVRPYIDAGVNLKATKNEMGVSTATPQVPIYMEPNDIMDFAGFTEGSRYNPGDIGEDMIVMSWHSAEDYLTDIYGPEKGIADIATTDRSDLASKIPATPLAKTNTAAEGTYTKDGIKHKVIVLTTEIGLSGSYLWMASVVEYWAPAAKFDLVEKVASYMQSSFKVKEQWAREEAVQVQKRSQIISQTSNEIMDMMNDSFQLRSESMDRIAHKYSDVTLGVTDVYDPDIGESYRVPNDSNYYWEKGYEIYGTDTADAPYPDPGFKLLQQLD